MTHKKTHLLIIDPQNDFCDLPAALCPPEPEQPGKFMTPALPVPGAHADMLRVAELIRQGGAGITDISITLDSHHYLDIAHPGFWQDGQGNPIPPFTTIDAGSVRQGHYRPRDPGEQEKTLEYLDTLEKQGRYQHMVWPVHCEIGTWGHNVHYAVRHAYNAWENNQLRAVNKFFKGTNPRTEHYSAVRAEVPLADDPATHTNHTLLDLLKQADQVLITGEAGSHCVRASTEHIVENLDAAGRSRLVLLTDCISPVSGFEANYAEFIDNMHKLGVRITQSTHILAELAQKGTV